MRIIQQRWRRSSTWPCCTKHKVICDKAEPSFSKPSMAAASNSVTLTHTQSSRGRTSSPSTKPGINQKKPKSGE